jgi:hypothetical protein
MYRFVPFHNFVPSLLAGRADIIETLPLGGLEIQSRISR